MPTVNRRQLLALGTLLMSPAQSLLAIDDTAASTLYLSAASTADDKHFLVGFRRQAASLAQAFTLPLPERGHHVAINRTKGFFVAVARRPGTSLVLAALDTGKMLREIRVPADRHLYGHGIFSADGNLFYTTENAFDDDSENSGRLVSWAVSGSGDTLTLERVRDIPTGGIGPHELLLMPDGETIAIANGGIRTHPSHDRDILNLETMKPSLAYIDRHSGRLLEQQFLPPEFHQSSIRHIDVNDAGLVVIGMQFEGEGFLEVPLVATHRRGERLQLLMAPPDVQPQMKQYVGSVRFAADGRFAAATCPRGNQFTLWDTRENRFLQTLRARDNCGVQATERGFLFSSGTGKLAELDLISGKVSEWDSKDTGALLWDNHLVRV